MMGPIPIIFIVLIVVFAISASYILITVLVTKEKLREIGRELTMAVVIEVLMEVFKARTAIWVALVGLVQS
jgi:hypothetical protein